MDPSAFDTLVRSIARSGTRRRLLAGLPLLGTLAVVGEDEAAAQRPLDRLQQRTTQRNRKQRNNNQNNNNNNNNNQNNGGGGGGGGNNNGGGGGGGLRTPNATCTCCPGTQVYYPDANVCCSPGQEGVAGNCCPPANICNNNQGQPVCCQHRCMSGVCCPCDNVASCQQCVVDVGQNPPQASCQTYCPAGQICTAAGCLPG